MSGAVDDLDHGDVDLVAAEYVIGTLDLSERVAVTGRLRVEPNLQRAVASWERRLSGLADTIDAIPVSPDVWTRIERAILASGFDVSQAPVASGSGPASRARHFEVIEGGAFLAAPRLRASRNRWRAAALLSGSIAAALLVFVGQRALVGVAPSSESVSYIAAVNRGGDKPALIVRVDLKTRQVFVRPVAADTPAGHSLELWYIGGGKPPRSMGVVDRLPETIPMPNGITATDASFAVSVEPQGGSRSGAPTGPVVYSGSLIRE